MPRWPNSDAPKCGAKCRSKGGAPCDNPPMEGSDRCRMHGGATPQARRKAAERVAEDKARKAMATYGERVETDPVTALLDEVCWTAGHVAWLRDRVREIEESKLAWGKTQVETADKESGEWPGTDTTTTEAAEQNAILVLYRQERAHLVAVCKAAISAGIEERRVKLAERQGDMLVAILEKIFGDLNLSPEQRALLPTVVPQRIREFALAA